MAQNRFLEANICGRNDIVSWFMNQEKVDVDTIDNKHRTALMIASNYGHTNIVSILLENDAYVNATDINGNTALMRACYKGRKNIVSMLLDNGADMNMKSCKGKTAIKIARKRGYDDIVSILKTRKSSYKKKNFM